MGLTKLSEHAWWHGGTSNYGGNYISNYVFLARIGKNFGQVIQTGQHPNLKSEYDVINWNFAFEGTGYSNDTAGVNRRMITYGMAIHIATDVYAHSAWKNGKHFDHAHDEDGDGIPDADDPSCEPKRFEVAREVARKIIVEYLKADSDPSYKQFCVDGEGYFRVRSLYFYAGCQAYGAGTSIYVDNNSTFLYSNSYK